LAAIVDVANPAKKILAALLPLLAVGACATPPSDPAARAQFEANNDPLEPLNRQIFAFDMFLDQWVIKPFAQVYQNIVPDPGKDAVRNFLDNLHEPVIFANNVLQTEFARAGWTAERFVLNSTVGIGGVFDVASKWGIEKQSGDFGQTLYHYGVPEMFYLVLPLLGPSNPRDAVGTVADGYADPFSYLAYDYGADVATYARWGAEGLDERAQNLGNLDELQKNAIDLYAEIRSLYRQHRASELRHGEPATSNEMDELYKDPGTAPDAPKPSSPAPSTPH
jgi:phospholipid-binding lipoprotein MlaA